MSRLLNCCLYLSLEACGTAQSEGPVFGEMLARDVVDEELELGSHRNQIKVNLT